MQIDFSKGMALHRLYGHSVFFIEASKKGKDDRFIRNICSSISCTGQPPHWLDDLLDDLLDTLLKEGK